MGCKYSYCSNLTSVYITDLSVWCNIRFDDSSSNPLCYAHHLYLNDKEIENLIIPDDVTSIGNYAFSGCSYLNFVTIHENVNSIGVLAFEGCSNLTTITIPEAMKNIGSNAFGGCSELTVVRLESKAILSASRTASTSMKSIFGGQVKEFVIGNSVESIGNYAFSECENLMSVTIPSSVTSIGKSAFEGCNSLTSVNITDLSAWCSIEFKESFSNPLYCAHHLYLNGEKIENLIIPNDVTYVKSHAFEGCSDLISTTFHESVATIDESAFKGCSSLTPVTIPNSVTYIGSSAFSDCSNLDVVTLESNAIVSTSRYNLLFWIDSLKTIFGNQVKEYIIGNSVTSIGNYAFGECTGMTSITIPESVTSIGQYAFYRCRGITSITISKNLTSIGLCAFAACGGLTSINVDNNNPNYDSRNNCNAIIETATNIMLKGCQNTIVPESVTRISHMAFSDCYDMTSFTIPENVTSIGQYTFSSCTGMDSIIIGSGVKSIESYALSDCQSLNKVYCLADSVPKTGSSVFVNSPIASATLYVPAVSVEEYKSTKPWSDFGTIVGLTGDNIREINNEQLTIDNKVIAIYDLNGHKLATPQKGINIIHHSDGSSKKVLIK